MNLKYHCKGCKKKIDSHALNRGYRFDKETDTWFRTLECPNCGDILGEVNVG